MLFVGFGNKQVMNPKKAQSFPGLAPKIPLVLEIPQLSKPHNKTAVFLYVAILLTGFLHAFLLIPHPKTLC